MKLVLAIFLGMCLARGRAASPFLVYGPPTPGAGAPFGHANIGLQRPAPGDFQSPLPNTDRPEQPDIPETPVEIQSPLPEAPVNIQNPLPETPVDIRRPSSDSDATVGLTNLFEQQQPDTPQAPVDIQSPLPETPIDIRRPLPENSIDIQEPSPDSDAPAGLTDLLEQQQPDIPEAPVNVQSPLPQSPVDIQRPLPESPEDIQNPLPESPVNIQNPLPESPVGIQRPLPESPVDIESRLPKVPANEPVVLLDRPLLVLRDDLGQYSVGLKSEGPGGQTLTERGRLISTNGGWEYVIAKTGSYSYTSPEGVPVSVEWEADHNGFRILRSSV